MTKKANPWDLMPPRQPAPDWVRDAMVERGATPEELDKVAERMFPPDEEFTDWPPCDSPTIPITHENLRAKCDEAIELLLALYGYCPENAYEDACISCKVSVVIRDLRVLREEGA